MRKITGLLLLMTLAGCNVTKHFQPNEYLLTANKFRINNPAISSDDLSGYLQQTPNTKLFSLFRTNIAVYNLGNKGKDTKFKKWLRTKVGSAPVLLDTTLVNVAVKQMKLFIDNKGYFKSRVYDSIVFHKKKAKVYYIVKTSHPYTFRNITYTIPDKEVASLVLRDTASSRIKKGKIYDSYMLDEERTRITSYLLDHGYYRFSTGFIVYTIDSTLRSRLMNINIEITNPVVPSLFEFGNFMEIPHQKYAIRKIFIEPQYNLLQTDTIPFDTLVFKAPAGPHDTIMNTYYLLHKGRLTIKPRTITQCIFIQPGANYNTSDVTKTYSMLSRLGIFQYSNIQFRDAPVNSSITKNLLDCHIQLTRAQTQSFSISTDGTNSGGALGLQANLTYLNRNIFHGAQLFRLNFNTSAQAQGSIGASRNKVFFNTLEFGANAGLTFPQFLIPIRPEKLLKNFRPKTTISLGYNFQRRPDYNRHISNVSFGYSWLQNDRISHVLNPIELLLVKVFPDSAFSSYLDKLTDKRLKNQYVDHIVAGLKYTITFSNQEVNKVKNFFYIRSNFETGGNLIYGIEELIHAKRSSSGAYTIFEIPFAQYFRPDIDFRFYQMKNKNIQIVYRFYGGVGIPYGNSISLPFEKAFFAGGANDLRGWKMGTLGPGSYHNDTLTTSFDQTGDLQLQANLEFRFPVYKSFKTALFVDAGNVWLLHDTPDLPGGRFQVDKFLSQIAIDAGIGIRADFDFFIIRLDPAVPIRVPYYPDQAHWFINKIQLKDIIWNFGIGYPF